MKYRYNVLQRVRQIEQKRGIKYAKPDGKLYKTLKVFYVIAFIYAMIMNFLFTLSTFVVYYGEENFSKAAPAIIIVLSASVLLIASLVIMRFKEQIWSNVTTIAVNVLTCVLLVLTFANLMEDGLGLWGLAYSFYWRHLAPLVLMVIFSVWLGIIALRANVKTAKRYKSAVENLYAEFNVAEDEENITEEQWQEFLEKYDPSGYKKMF